MNIIKKKSMKTLRLFFLISYAVVISSCNGNRADKEDIIIENDGVIFSVTLPLVNPEMR